VTLEFLKQNGMKETPHPPYLPDLAPSDSISYLFGYIKQVLAGHEFPDREALVEVVGHIPDGIEKVTFDQVFLTWMEGLERHITTSAEYLE
jgi:hypothetical protein